MSTNTCATGQVTVSLLPSWETAPVCRRHLIQLLQI